MSQSNINYYLNQTLDGIPQDLYQTVVDSLALLGKGPFFENVTAGYSYREKMDALRYAYTALMHYLIENRLNDLNAAQRVFVNTGAITDHITFEDHNKKLHKVHLLDTEIYNALFEKVLNIPNDLPLWNHTIYRMEDQFNAIALGILEPVGLDKKSLARFRTLRGLDQQAALSLEQSTILAHTYEALSQQSQQLFTELKALFENFENHVQALPQLRNHLERTERFYKALNEWKESEDVPLSEFASTLSQPLESGKYIEAFAKDGEGLLHDMKDKSALADLKVQQLKDALLKLKQVGLEDMGSVRERDDLVFDRETVKLIKTNFNVHANFATSESQKSSMKIPESASRILLSAHAKGPNPLEESYCTVQNLTAAFEKIIQIHVNLFDRDDAGNPILPPTLIEPIRNYVDWADERFSINFVSGENSRQGIRYSFSPIDMSVLRACGKYTFRENIFDYRGNRLEGTLMADYSARMESATAVKWTGEEMKFKLITMMKEVDEASRSEAIEDYMEFIFHAANDFPAPLGLSKRKMAVMLKYIIVESVPKTAGLILRYVADKEPEEAKEALLKHVDYNRKKIPELLSEALEIYKAHLPQPLSHYLLILGL